MSSFERDEKDDSFFNWVVSAIIDNSSDLFESSNYSLSTDNIKQKSYSFLNQLLKNESHKSKSIAYLFHIDTSLIKRGFLDLSNQGALDLDNGKAPELNLIDNREILNKISNLFENMDLQINEPKEIFLLENSHSIQLITKLSSILNTICLSQSLFIFSKFIKKIPNLGDAFIELASNDAHKRTSINIVAIDNLKKIYSNFFASDLLNAVLSMPNLNYTIEVVSEMNGNLDLSRRGA